MRIRGRRGNHGWIVTEADFVPAMVMESGMAEVEWGSFLAWVRSSIAYPT